MSNSNQTICETFPIILQFPCILFRYTACYINPFITGQIL